MNATTKAPWQRYHVNRDNFLPLNHWSGEVGSYPWELLYGHFLGDETNYYALHIGGQVGHYETYEGAMAELERIEMSLNPVSHG